MLNELTPLFADGIGHNNLNLIALHRTDKSKTDALISACRLNDYRIRIEQSPALRIVYHIKCRTGLDRAADVESFKLNEYFSILGDVICCNLIIGVFPIASRTVLQIIIIKPFSSV